MAGTTTSGRVKVVITGDAKGLLNVITEVNDKLNKMGADVRVTKLSAGFAKLTANVGRFGGAVSKAANLLIGFRSIMGIIAVGSLGKSILDTAIQFNKWDASLSAVLDSAKEVIRVKQMLGAQAEYLGQRYITLIEQYTKFRAASEAAGMALEHIDMTFRSVSKAAAVFQLDGRDTYEIFRALTQMISKGTISAEELRGQFGERLPAALSIMADALGVSLQQLLKMMENGELLADVTIPKLAKGLEETFGQKVKRVLDTTQANLNRFFNALDMFKNKIAVGGSLEAFDRILKNLSDTLSDPRFQTSAAEVVKGIMDMAEAISELVDKFAKIPRELYGIVLGMLGGAMVGGPWGAVIGGVVGGAGMAATRLASAQIDEAQRLAARLLDVQDKIDSARAQHKQFGSYGEAYGQKTIQFEKTAGYKQLIRERQEIEMQMHLIRERQASLDDSAVKDIKQGKIRIKELEKELTLKRMLLQEEVTLAKAKAKRDTMKGSYEGILASDMFSDDQKEIARLKLVSSQIDVDKAETKLAERRKRNADARINLAAQVKSQLLRIDEAYYKSIGDEEAEGLAGVQSNYDQQKNALQKLRDTEKITNIQFNDAMKTIDATRINEESKVRDDAEQKRIKAEEARINSAAALKSRLLSIEADYYRSLGDDEKDRLLTLQENYDKEKILLDKLLATNKINKEQHVEYMAYLDATLANESVRIHSESVDKKLQKELKYYDHIKRLMGKLQQKVDERGDLERKITDLSVDRKMLWDAEYEQMARITRQVEDYRKALERSDQSFSVEKITSMVNQYEEALTKLAESKALKKMGSFFTDHIVDPLMEAVDGTKSLKEAFKDMTRSIIMDLAKMALKAGIMKAIGAISESGGFSSGGSIWTRFFSSANGNAFSGGNMMAYARGGIVNSPTIFPMARGVGLMGEAGPEAILPLSRGTNGKLGVQGGGGGNVNNINVIVKSDGQDQAQSQRMGNIIAKQIKEQMIGVINDERRFGGVLNSQNSVGIA